MKGKGTTDAIFIVRQMQEKFRAKVNPGQRKEALFCDYTAEPEFACTLS